MSSRFEAGGPPGQRLLSGGPAHATLVALLLLASLYTLYLARGFLLPLTLAGVLTLLLRPFVRALQRIRVPERIGAALVVGSLVAIALVAVQGLTDPARELLRTAPERLRRIERNVRALRQPIAEVKSATEEVERIARGSDVEAPTEVVAQGQTLSGSVARTLRTILVESVITVFLLYFLLASGGSFREKLKRIVKDPGRADRIIGTGADIEREVSAYLLTVTLINCGEGLLIGFAAWALGMPAPVLWGVIAALLNFVPYIGPIAGATAMTVTALATLPAERALLVPLIYLIVSSIEGYLVTPLVVGRRLVLDPVAVFLSVIFWGWLWGALGTLLAVPLLVALQATSKRFENLAPIAELIGGAPKGAGRLRKEART